MAHVERNKTDYASAWGDADPIGLQVENDNAADYARDADSVPTKGIENKFNAGGRLGDTAPLGPAGAETGPKDFAADSAGLPSVNQGEKTDWDMALEPNKFPRETGHDSLGGEDASYLV